MAYNTLKALKPRENLTEKYRKDRAVLETDFQKHLDEWKQTAVMVVNLAKKYGDREQLHHKPYGQWETFSWNQVSEIMFAVAGALLDSGLKEGDRTGFSHLTGLSGTSLISVRSL
jgi:acyl-CoA synthetase (AMP-forming)/AMP-acid ligase II